MSKLKVYGMQGYRPGMRQTREIVAAKNKAMSEPGIVFAKPINETHRASVVDWTRFEPEAIT